MYGLSRYTTNLPESNLTEINNKLDKFIQAELTPTTSFVTTGNQYTDKIFKFLQGFGSFDIGRTLIGGSIGKGTALGEKFKPDYDLVVFLNKQSPPFEEFLTFFDKELEKWGKKEFGKEYSHGSSTPFSLSLKIGIYNFDLLPAVNFIIRGGRPTNQQQRGLESIRDSGHPSSKHCGGAYSASLAELSVQFVADQPLFTRNVVRLAKYFNKCVAIKKDVYIPGRSTIIELIAIHANAKKRKRHIYTGFKRFLMAMSRLDTLDVTFKNCYSKVPAEVLLGTQLPYVFDPGNPYNNIAHKLGKNKEVMKKFMEKAEATLNKLDELGGVGAKTMEEVIGVPYNK